MSIDEHKSREWTKTCSTMKFIQSRHLSKMEGKFAITTSVATSHCTYLTYTIYLTLHQLAVGQYWPKNISQATQVHDLFWTEPNVPIDCVDTYILIAGLVCLISIIWISTLRSTLSVKTNCIEHQTIVSTFSFGTKCGSTRFWPREVTSILCKIWFNKS